MSENLRKLSDELGELLASSREADQRTDYSRYADDPVGFLREVLKFEPWWRQEEIAELVRDHDRVVVRSANGIGKDAVAARLALWWVYAIGGRVLLTGPTDRQVGEILMRREIATAFRAGRLAGDLLTRALRLPGDPEARIIAFTSRETSRLTGFHGERVLAILTEAQGLDDHVWEAVTACAVGARDRVLAVGNPTEPTGRFFTISKDRSDWAKLAIPASEHPNVVEGREVIPGGITRAAVERFRRDYGEGSPIYVARVLGEFPEEPIHGLVKRAWLERAFEAHEAGDLAREAADRSERWAAGVDVARSGADRTCVALRRGAVVPEIVTWRGADLMETCGRIVEYLRSRQLGPDPHDDENPLLASERWPYGPGMTDDRLSLIVDTTGLGEGVRDRLFELGLPATGFKSAGRAHDRRRFRNRRAELYWRLRDRLEAGTIALPRDEELAEELLATEWFVESTGKIQIVRKKEIRSKLGRSPDKADAVVMALADAGIIGGAMVTL